MDKGGSEMAYIPKLKKVMMCPVEYALNVFGGKWKIRVVGLLNYYEIMRYNEIKKDLDNITDAVLAATLKEMVEDGIIERMQYEEIPPRVEYALTDKTKIAMPILQDLCLWAKNHSDMEFMQLVPCQTCEIHNN